jgi:hypothetical protein
MDNEKQNYSPRLREAMAEIRSIIERYDIAANVILHEPGFSEYLQHISPSWSILKFEAAADGLGVRVRSKLAEYGGDKERQRREVEASVNMLVHFVDVLGMTQQQLAGVLKMLHGYWEIEEGPGVHTPHR